MELCRGEVPAAPDHPAGGMAPGVSSPEMRGRQGESGSLSGGSSLSGCIHPLTPMPG